MNMTNISFNTTLWTNNILQNKSSFAFNEQAVNECKEICINSISGMSNNKDLVLPGCVAVLVGIVLIYYEYKKPNYERDNFLIIMYFVLTLFYISFVLKFLEIF